MGGVPGSDSSQRMLKVKDQVKEQSAYEREDRRGYVEVLQSLALPC